MHNVLNRLAAAEKRVKELEAGHAEARAALIDKLEELELLLDKELAHSEGDKAVSTFLRRLGHSEAANAYDAAREGWFYD